MVFEVSDREVARLSVRGCLDPRGERRQAIRLGQAVSLDEENPAGFCRAGAGVPEMGFAPNARHPQNDVLTSKNLPQANFVEACFGICDNEDPVPIRFQILFFGPEPDAFDGIAPHVEDGVDDAQQGETVPLPGERRWSCVLNPGASPAGLRT